MKNNLINNFLNAVKNRIKGQKMVVYRLNVEDLLEMNYVNDNKCGGCNWTTSYLYVGARSEKESLDMVQANLAGLCSDCFCDLLVDSKIPVSL